MLNNYSDIINIAKNHNCEVLLNEPMCKHTSFKIGGPCDVFINITDDKALIDILKICKQLSIPYHIIGNGSNLLVSDNGIRGLCIKLAYDHNVISLNDNIINCKANISLSRLCKFALDNSLSGLEFAWGIPGSVGGAAFMNAGAYSGEMKNVLIECRHIDNCGNIGSFSKNELKLSYRHSIYSELHYIITDVKVKLHQDNYIDIKKRMDDFMSRRKSKQPLEFPSAGSIFKRPYGFFAGSLIEECGLKGKSVGGAMVSEKHAGFIINTGNATCKDVLDLIALIQKTVYENKGVNLECEVKQI